jgi:hypothetical protein
MERRRNKEIKTNNLIKQMALDEYGTALGQNNK